MEEETARLHLDELSDYIFLRDVSQDQVLRVVIEDGEAIRNLARVFSLLFEEQLLHLLHLGAPAELRMHGDLT